MKRQAVLNGTLVYYKGYTHITPAARAILAAHGVNVPKGRDGLADSFYCPANVAALLKRTPGNPACPGTLAAAQVAA